MATINKTFSVRNGIDVANTVIVSNSSGVINVSNITLMNVVTLNVSGNIANTGNLSVTQNTVTGNLSVTSLANVATANLTNFGVANAGTGVIAGVANLNFNGSGTVNVAVTANGTNQANVTLSVNTSAFSGAANVYANSGLVLATAGNLTFNNTASVNASVIANGTNSANIGFTVNTTMNLVSLNVSSNIANAGNILVSQNTVTGNLTVVQNVSSGNISAANISITSTANIGVLNVSTSANVTGTINATANISSGNVIVAQNIAGGNIAVTQNLSAGNISAANLSITSTANVGVLNVSTSANVTGTINATANISAGNLALSQNASLGNLTATQNVSAGNLVATSLISGATGSFSGQVTIGGNLIVNGTTITLNSSSISTNDQYIYILSNNAADTLDAGITVLSKNSTQGNVYSGLVRHAADEIWHLFEGYALMNGNPATINTAQTNVSTLNANVIAQQVTIGSDNVQSYMYAGANTVAFSQNGTVVLSKANLNFNNSSSLNVIATANGTGQVNVSFSVNSTSLGASTYQEDVYANGTIVLANATLNFNNTATVNIAGTANGTTQANIAFSANGTALGIPAINASLTTMNTQITLAQNTVATYQNGTIVLANANLNFNNSASVLIAPSANGTGQSNLQFSVNTTLNLVSLNVSSNIANAGNLLVSQNIYTGNLIVSQNISTGNLSLTSANASGTVNVAGNITINTLAISVNSVTLATVSQTGLDNFSPLGVASGLCAVEYLVQANCANTIHVTKLIVVTDGTNIYMDEYSTIQTGGPVGTFTAAIASGNAQLLFTANNATSTTVRTARYALQS